MLAACGDLEDNPSSLVASILNGSDDPGHPAIGSIQGGPSFCTATLLGSKTVLVAAHCLQDTVPYTFSLGGKTYAVASLKPHPNWAQVSSFPELPNADWKFSIHDIGVVLLKDPVQGIKPMRVAYVKPPVGQAVSLIGFGSGKKEKAANVVGAIGKDFVLYGTIGGLTGTNGLTCMGDSGGPTLVKEAGEERVLGVHSMANCTTYTQDTRVSTHLKWLKAQSSEIVDPPDGGPPKDLDAGPADSGPEAAPAPDSGLQDSSPVADLGPPVETDPACSVGAPGQGRAALPLLLLLLWAVVRSRAS